MANEREPGRIPPIVEFQMRALNFGTGGLATGTGARVLFEEGRMILQGMTDSTDVRRTILGGVALVVGLMSIRQSLKQRED